MAKLRQQSYARNPGGNVGLAAVADGQLPSELPTHSVHLRLLSSGLVVCTALVRGYVSPLSVETRAQLMDES